MSEAVRKIEDATVTLRSPFDGPMRVKDLAAAMASLRAACLDDPEKLDRLDAIEALSREDQERWLIGRARPRERTVQTGCAVVVAVVTVVVGYIIVKYFDEVTKQWRERREPKTEEKEVEKVVCPGDH